MKNTLAKKQMVLFSSFLLLSSGLMHQASLKAQDIKPEPIAEINENLLDTVVILEDVPAASETLATPEKSNNESDTSDTINYEVKLQEYRDSLLRSLKQFANLQIHYTVLKNPTLITQLSERIGLKNIEVDVKNTEELLDGLATVINQKLTVYTNYLAYLASLAEHTDINEKSGINKIDQSINSLWQKNTLNDLKTYAVDWNKSTITLGQILFTWPCVYNLLLLARNAYRELNIDHKAKLTAELKDSEKKREIIEQTIITAVLSSVFGTLLGVINYYLQNNIGNIPMHYSSPEIQGLYERVSLATAAEEALNKALNLPSYSNSAKPTQEESTTQTA